MDHNRKLVCQHFAEKTGRPVTMKYIHNIATRAKKEPKKSNKAKANIWGVG